MQLRDLLDDPPTTDGDVIPLEFKQLLREPLEVFADGERAERLLLDARSRLPERLEIPVALYKLYAYTNRFAESLALIHEVLERSATRAGFPADWRALKGSDSPWTGPATGDPRLYLYTLKALGFVSLRAGDLDTACRALEKLHELDPGDQVGGSVVRQMAERLAEEMEA
ncbi:tetratricopeptide repeat protein [Endothiovibrio diazotrophicus]